MRLLLIMSPFPIHNKFVLRPKSQNFNLLFNLNPTETILLLNRKINMSVYWCNFWDGIQKCCWLIPDDSLVKGCIWPGTQRTILQLATRAMSPATYKIHKNLTHINTSNGKHPSLVHCHFLFTKIGASRAQKSSLGFTPNNNPETQPTHRAATVNISKYAVPKTVIEAWQHYQSDSTTVTIYQSLKPVPSSETDQILICNTLSINPFDSGKQKKKFLSISRLWQLKERTADCHCCYPSPQDIGFLIFSVSSRHLSMLWNCSWGCVVQCQDIFSHSCGSGFVMYVRLTYKQTQQTQKRPNANWRIESNQKLLAWSPQKPQPYGFPKMQKN